MKNLKIKLMLGLMFVSGVLLMDIFNIQWQIHTKIVLVHVLCSLFIAIFFLIPFVNKHSYYYIVEKKVNSLNGWFLGFILLLNTLSGFYLFFIGNRQGDIIGILSADIHLYSSFVFIIVFFLHIKKIVQKPQNISALFLLLFLALPSISYSEDKKFNSLSNLEIEDKVEFYHSQDWSNSSKCKSCHEDIFNQWANSNHKNLVGSNPYYMVLETLAGEVEGEEFKKWCMSCHNPSTLTTGGSKTGHSMSGNFLNNTIFEKDAKTLLEDFAKHGNTQLEEGVSCITCHRIVKTKAKGNASYSINLRQQKKYPFENEDHGIKKFLSEKFINANPKEHKEAYSKELYKKSSYCASCHDETSPLTNKKIVNTYGEWKDSPYNNLSDKTKHETCIDCHMTNLDNNKFSPLKGASTKGGKIKDDVKVHYFSGSNHFLSGLKSKKHEDQTIQLLKTAAKLDVNIKDKKISVGVTNVGAGHHLPTGVADFRELWLDITVKDAKGKTIFSSGKLKKDGDLGKDARPFMKVFADKDGKEVGLLFWRYEKLLSDTRIPAKKRRVEVYEIKEELNYPLSILVKLNFRIYPQWVTSLVQKAYPALPNPPVVILQELRKKFFKK